MERKSVLIVYAHQEPHKSFNAALKDEAVKVLESDGHNVQVSDLYSLNWDPIASKNDFAGKLQSEEAFSYIKEQSYATQKGMLAEDIQAEQKKVKEADLVIFQFPMYWFSVPAILKGWFDKVFAVGVTHSFPNNVFEDGLMKGKKALLSLTTGGSQDTFVENGINGDINMILWPLHWGTLSFTGFDVLMPNIAFATSYCSMEERRTTLTNWKSRLQTVFSEKAIQLREKRWKLTI